VYGNGRSERLIAQLKKERKGELIVVATKAGRKLPKQTVEGYSKENLQGWIDESLKNLETDCLDLLQLHCPPTSAYDHAEIFETLDGFVKKGKILSYGVSVEKVEEALKAIEYEGVQTVQIIFNCFRQKPAEEFFEQAKKKQVGILARVPLASGILTGKMTKETQFEADDHRNFNRNGEAFDVGETFSGVDYDVALAAVEELKALMPVGMTMSQFALRWILMFEAVTCAIPGGKTPQQVMDNAKASDLPGLSVEVMAGVKRVYDEKIKTLVQERW
jgi:aryl-alcohol dehydrogenase-like predicted oxidoreductase